MLPKDSSSDRFGLPRHCALARSTIVRRVAIRLRPSSGAWNSRGARMPAEARGDLVEFRTRRVVRSSIRSRSRPESAASHSGRDHFSMGTKTVEQCSFPLSPADLSADQRFPRVACSRCRPKFGLSHFWSRLFYDTCENGRMMPLLIVAKGFIIRPVRASVTLPACGVDHRRFRRNPVETIQWRMEFRLCQDICRGPR